MNEIYLYKMIFWGDSTFTFSSDFSPSWAEPTFLPWTFNSFFDVIQVLQE